MRYINPMTQTRQAIEDMIVTARKGTQKYGSSGTGHFYSQKLIGGTIVETYDYPNQPVRVELPYITGIKGLDIDTAVDLISQNA